MQTETRALLKIGLLTNLFEWYEFSIYGYLAGTLGLLFFKTTQPTLALLLGFLPFTVSYVIRPLGGLFFGYIGDRIGRKQALNLSLFMMSIPTILIGLLPVYNQIGPLSIFCLVALRLVQGFGSGGEKPLMGCYIFENAKLNKKGLLSSTVNIGGILGFLSGSFTATLLVWYFNQEVILSWAWRIPFLLGIPITAYIFYVRQRILKISVPLKSKASSLKNSNPITSLISQHKSQLLKTIILGGFAATCSYSLTIWMPTYLTHFIGLPQKISSLMNTTILCIMPLFWISAGYFSDLLDYKKIMLYSTISILIGIYPLFLILQTKSYGLIIFSQLLYALVLSGLDALLILYVGNSFPNLMRASGMSLGITLGASLGGMTPLVCTWLIHQTGHLIAPAFYIMAFGLLALPVVLTLKKPTEVTSK